MADDCEQMAHISWKWTDCFGVVASLCFLLLWSSSHFKRHAWRSFRSLWHKDYAILRLKLETVLLFGRSPWTLHVTANSMSNQQFVLKRMMLTKLGEYWAYNLLFESSCSHVYVTSPNQWEVSEACKFLEVVFHLNQGHIHVFQIVYKTFYLFFL